jgi:hypothetical protein
MIHDLQAIIRRRPLAQVLHADPLALPATRGQKHLTIVAAGLSRRRLNNEKPELA